MRRVIVIFGPPGAGKTTLARSLDLDVYDRDDPQWHNDERRFTAALSALARDEQAQAVVIRAGATRSARDKALALCRATESRILTTPADECRRRVAARGRGDVRSQIAGVDTWWRTYEPEPEESGLTSRRW